MTTLALANVRKSFGGVRALDDCTLSIQPAQITGLIGPNGAGKTTVVNLITGMLQVDGGRIDLGGQDITRAPAVARARAGIARTFQNIRLMRDESVIDNVVIGFHRHETTSLTANLLALPSALRERRVLRERAAELLASFNMLPYAGQNAGSLPYGYQRRVEIIRALATSPSVLLLDEPVAGMNDVEAQELGEIFHRIAERGTAILLIEHNMRFVMSTCAEVNVLHTGVIIASGPPSVVHNDPAVITAYLGE